MRCSSCTAAAPHLATLDQVLTLTVGIAITHHARKTTSTHTLMHLSHASCLPQCLYAAVMPLLLTFNQRTSSHAHSRRPNNPACNKTTYTYMFMHSPHYNCCRHACMQLYCCSSWHSNQNTGSSIQKPQPKSRSAQNHHILHILVFATFLAYLCSLSILAIWHVCQAPAICR